MLEKEVGTCFGSVNVESIGKDKTLQSNYINLR